MNAFIETLCQKTTGGYLPNADDARQLLSENLFDVMYYANKLREHFVGNTVYLCSLVSAKTGGCSEDCAFCSQSIHYPGTVKTHALLSVDEIVECAKQAERQSAACEFAVVTSGTAVTDPGELDIIAEAVRRIKTETRLEPCVSLGLIDADALHMLKEAGVEHVHHNLETARSHILNIRTTHTYDDDIAVVRAAKSFGFKICCGGIFGMGESWEQRIEFLLTLRELDADGVPINLLDPRPGTPLGDNEKLTPADALRIIALARFILPAKNIKVLGGREAILGDLQPLLFLAGANGILSGDYLTTKGQSTEKDLAMISALGLQAAANA